MCPRLSGRIPGRLLCRASVKHACVPWAAAPRRPPAAPHRSRRWIRHFLNRSFAIAAVNRPIKSAPRQPGSTRSTFPRVAEARNRYGRDLWICWTVRRAAQNGPLRRGRPCRRLRRCATDRARPEQAAPPLSGALALRGGRSPRKPCRPDPPFPRPANRGVLNPLPSNRERHRPRPTACDSAIEQGFLPLTGCAPRPTAGRWQSSAVDRSGLNRRWRRRWSGWQRIRIAMAGGMPMVSRATARLHNRAPARPGASGGSGGRTARVRAAMPTRG